MSSCYHGYLQCDQGKPTSVKQVHNLKRYNCTQDRTILGNRLGKCVCFTCSVIMLLCFFGTFSLRFMALKLYMGPCI